MKRLMLRLFDSVVARRRWILILFLLTASVLVLTVRPTVKNDSERLWLEGSSVEHKLRAAGLQASYIYRVSFDVGGLDAQKLQGLHRMFRQMKAIEGVNRIEGIFSTPLPFVVQGDASSSRMFSFMTLDSAMPENAEALLRKYHDRLMPFIGLDARRVDFYLFSEVPGNVTLSGSPFPYHITEPFADVTPMQNWGTLVVLFMLFLIAMGAIFKSWVAPLSASLFMIVMAAVTLSLFDWLELHRYENLSIVLVAWMIGMTNYLFFYYKWHVGQHRLEASKALKYAYSRTLIPQLLTMTAVLIALGGSMLLSDSAVLFSLGLFTGISMVVSTVMMLLFAPAMLSMFRIENPGMIGIRYFDKMASRLGNMHPVSALILLLALLVGGLIVSLGIFQKELDKRSVGDHMVTASLVATEIDDETVAQLQQMEERLGYIEGVSHVESFITYMRFVYPQDNFAPYDYAQASVAGTRFYLELFGQDGVVFNGEHPLVRIYLEDGNTGQKVVSALQGLPFADKLLISDISSQISAAKFEMLGYIVAVGLVLLVMIAGIVAFLGKRLQLALQVLFMNALPIVLFVLLVWLMRLPLGIELFVAILLGIAITSDAELHQFYNIWADGKTVKDDVVGVRQERFHTAAVTVFVHSALLVLLVLLALFAEGFLAITATYLGIIIFMSTLVDLYMLSRIVAADRKLT